MTTPVQLQSHACFHAAFCADDTCVEILPEFDLTVALPLLSSGTRIGPWKAGIASTVPLWLALQLQAKSLARIVPPDWLEVNNLKAIIDFEKNNELLFADETRLPRHYGSIGRRIVKDQGVLSLLLQDVLDTRLDKLRQQFLSVLKDTSEHDVMATVNGIAAEEIALLQDFFAQALHDQYQLGKSLERQEESQNNGRGPEKEAPVNAGSTTMTTTTTRARIPVRRFRK